MGRSIPAHSNRLLLLYLFKPQVTEIYLEDLRDFCPFLQKDLHLSTYVDTLSRRGGGALSAKPALEDKMMEVCVKTLAALVAPGEVALVFVAGT